MADNKLAPQSKNKLPWYEQALSMEGRAAFLPYQDTLPGSVMNQRSFALPGIIAGAANAITAPGRAYSGSDPMFDPQEEAANFALNMMGGGMGASRAAPAPAGSLGMFIGKNAKTWDPIAAAKAIELEKAGVDAKAIWQQTGTWKAPDGMWRQEIPDATAGFRMDFNSAVPSKSNAYMPVRDLPIGGAFNHPDLYPAYPDILRTGRMEVAKSPDWMPASSNSGSQRGNQFTVRDKTEAGARSTVLHELQHAVQQREGFASGGTQSQFYNEALLRLVAENPRTPLSRLTKAAEDEAFARYRALMGEAEARATQARANLTAAERRKVFPEESYDLPLQLLRAK
jgi:hypothetical protein